MNDVNEENASLARKIIYDKEFLNVIALLFFGIPLASLSSVLQFALLEMTNNFAASTFYEQLVLAINLGNLIVIEKIIELGLQWITNST